MRLPSCRRSILPPQYPVVASGTTQYPAALRHPPTYITLQIDWFPSEAM
jgi:hypothetical protein